MSAALFYLYEFLVKFFFFPFRRLTFIMFCVIMLED